MSTLSQRSRVAISGSINPESGEFTGDGSQVFCVRDWAELYETHDTRKLKHMMWVPVPNRMDGEGYGELVEHQNGAAHFGVWCAVLEIASTCRPRGVLWRNNGGPHTPESLARKSRIPVALFAEALPRLLEIGWLENRPAGDVIGPGPEDERGDPPKPQRKAGPAKRLAKADEAETNQLEPDNHPSLPGTSGKNGGSARLNGREWNGLEENDQKRSEIGEEADALFDFFLKSYPGPKPNNLYRLFTESLERNPSQVKDFRPNTQLWLKTKKTSAGYGEKPEFYLKNDVWLHAPLDPELTAQALEDEAIRKWMAERPDAVS